MSDLTKSAYEVMKAQELVASAECPLCHGDSLVCSHGIHFLRAIQRGELTCRAKGCKNIAAIARNGKAYCGQH